MRRRDRVQGCDLHGEAISTCPRCVRIVTLNGTDRDGNALPADLRAANGGHIEKGTPEGDRWAPNIRNDTELGGTITTYSEAPGAEPTFAIVVNTGGEADQEEEEEEERDEIDKIMILIEEAMLPYPDHGDPLDVEDVPANWEQAAGAEADWYEREQELRRQLQEAKDELERVRAARHAEIMNGRPRRFCENSAHKAEDRQPFRSTWVKSGPAHGVGLCSACYLYARNHEGGLRPIKVIYGRRR